MFQVTEDCPQRQMSLLLPRFHFLFTVTGYVYLVFLPQLGTSPDSPTSGPIGPLTVLQNLWVKVNTFMRVWHIVWLVLFHQCDRVPEKIY